MDYLTVTILLSLERVVYSLIWNFPKTFGRVATKVGFNGKEPELICRFVSLFKFVTAYVFISWYHGNFGFSFPDPSVFQYLIGLFLICVGQGLNALVWYRIGIDGVCYGNKFGRKVPWCTQFPFNVLDHPQYLGVVLTVWGSFVFTWSQSDWYIIPTIETALYGVSMYFLEV